MKYQPPVGGSANDPYVDGSSSTEGSIPPAASIEQPMREIVNAIAGAGLVASDADLSQLLQMVKIFSGSHVKTVTADSTLGISDAGTVLVDASAANITLTLPAADVLTALSYTFIRVDSAATTVTIAPSGTDTVDGKSSVELGINGIRSVEADGTSDWTFNSPKKADSSTLNSGSDDEQYATAKGLLSGFLGGGTIGGNGYAALPFRDASTGERKEIIVQWMSISAPSGYVINFPIAFAANFKLASSVGFGSGLTSVNYSFSTNGPPYSSAQISHSAGTTAVNFNLIMVGN